MNQQRFLSQKTGWNYHTLHLCSESKWCFNESKTLLLNL